MKFEVGKTYLTRDGRKAVITGIAGSGGYPISGFVEDISRTWTQDGVHFIEKGKTGLDIVIEVPSNPWKTGPASDAPTEGVEVKHLSDGWAAWRKVEPVRETATGECWAYHYGAAQPRLIPYDDGGCCAKGTYTTERVDGKVVRIEWVADQ